MLWKGDIMMGFKDLRGKLNQLNPLSQLKRNTSFDPKLLLHGLQALNRLIFIVEIRNGTCIYTYANEAALDVLHYDTTLYGKTFEEVLSNESATYLTSEYIKCISTKEVIEIEDNMDMTTGEKIIHQSTLSPFFHQGRSFVIAVVKDVTEEILLEEKLRRAKKNEQRLSSLVENSADAVFLLNDQGFLLEINEAGQQSTGFTDQHLIGKHLTDVLAARMHDTLNEKLEQSLRGETVSYESILYHKDGHEVLTHVMHIPIEVDGEIQGVYGITRDITAYKQYEEALRKEKAEFQSFIQSSPLAIAILGPDKTVQYINDAFTMLYDFSEAEVLGKELPTVPDWLKNDTLAMYQQVLNKDSLQSMDVKRKKKSEELLDVKMTAYPVYDELGHVSGLAVIENDQTESKRLERQMMAEKVTLDYLWNYTPSALCFIGYDGKIARVNPGFETLFGMKRDEVERRPFASIQPEHLYSHVESVLWRLQEDKEKKPIQSITKQVLTDGTVLDVEVTYQPIQENNILAVAIYKDITNLMERIEELKTSEELYRTIVENSPEATVVHQEGKISYINPKGLELVRAASLSQVIGKPVYDFIHADDREVILERIQRAEQKLEQAETKLERFITVDGTEIVADASNVPIILQNKQSVLVSVRDVTNQRRAEKAMQESEERFRIIAENSVDIIKVINPQGIITYASPAVEYILGYPVRDFIGTSFLEFVHLEDVERLEKQFQSMLETKEKMETEARRIHQDGHSLWLHSNVVPIVNSEHEVEKVIVISRDTTDNKRKEEKLSKLAYYDVLTGLPNRRLFEDRFAQAAYTTDRTGKLTALMVLDCDRFKSINDTLGHDVGDEVIKEIAKRVRLAIRKTDTLSRLGGDEFTIVLPEVGSEREVVEIAERILQSIRVPLPVQGHTLNITTSIGISFYPKDGGDYEEVFKAADNSLYQAKENGRDTYFYVVGSSNIELLNEMEGEQHEV